MTLNKTITPVQTWSTPKTFANGDEYETTNHEDQAQRLANRDEYLRPGVPGRATSYLLHVAMAVHLNTNSRFTAQQYGYWRQTDITDAGWLEFCCPLPPLGQISKVTAYVDNGSGRAGLPGTMPRLELHQVEHDGTVTQVCAADDPSASLGAYEIPHSWDATPASPPHTIVSGSYAIVFKGEAGANAMANLLNLVDVIVEIEP